jgi:GT2 family glycosyltransferase
MNQTFDKLAILIPTRNRPGILAATLEELRHAGVEHVPLWIYDDCSSDPAAILKTVESWPQVRVISGRKRVGQAEGRNILMRSCGKEFGLFLDDDSFPRSVTGLEEHLNYRTDLHRAIITFQYMDVPTQRYSTPVDTEAGVSRSFQGGGSLFHIPTILGLGGFRSFFVYGYEEPELSCRLQMNGFHIWYDPSIVVHHNHFETPAEFRDHREYDYLYARNSILMSSLNMPLWFGVPHGLLKSVRRSFFRHRHAWAKAKGTLSGLWLTFARWKDRTPCSNRQVWKWLHFNRSCPR